MGGLDSVGLSSHEKRKKKFRNKMKRQFVCPCFHVLFENEYNVTDFKIVSLTTEITEHSAVQD
jgi:hypothetical protein